MSFEADMTHRSRPHGCCKTTVAVLQHHSKTGGISLRTIFQRRLGSRFCSLNTAPKGTTTHAAMCAHVLSEALRGNCTVLEVHLPDWSVSAYLASRLGVHCVTTFGVVREPLATELSMCKPNPHLPLVMAPA